MRHVRRIVRRVARCSKPISLIDLKSANIQFDKIIKGKALISTAIRTGVFSIIKNRFRSFCDLMFS